MMLSTEQYNSIRRIYEERRRESELALRERRGEVRAALPQYRALEEEIASRSLACTERLIAIREESERDALLVKLRERISAIEEEQRRLMTDAGFPADYLTPRYVCEKCQDTGYVGDQKCSCFRQLEASFLYDESRIRDFLERNNFSRLEEHYYLGEDLERFRDAVSKSRLFINNFGKDYHNLLFYGTVGTGKSFLSGCIAKELLDLGHSVLYFSADQLFETISSAMRDPERAALDRLYDALYGAELLIIDDLGVELTNDFTRSQLLGIVNERILHRRPFIISTNLGLNELRETYSERFNSRLMESAYFCRFSGKDIRLQIKLEELNGTASSNESTSNT